MQALIGTPGPRSRTWKFGTFVKGGTLARARTSHATSSASFVAKATCRRAATIGEWPSSATSEVCTPVMARSGRAGDALRRPRRDASPCARAGARAPAPAGTHAQPYAHTASQTRASGASDAAPIAYADAHSDASTKANAAPNAKADARTPSNTDADAGPNADAPPDANANAAPDSYANANTNAAPDSYANTNTDANANANANTDPHAHTDSDGSLGLAWSGSSSSEPPALESVDRFDGITKHPVPNGRRTIRSPRRLHSQHARAGGRTTGDRSHPWRWLAAAE